MKYLSFVFTIALLFCCSNKKEPPNNKVQGFENDLKQLKEYFQIPGLSVLVKKDGNILYENYFGYADIETKRAVDSTTIFPIASITKTFSAVVLLKLVEEGKVDLEDPINDYLENSRFSDSVKVKHVLSHSSEGIPGTFFNYSNRFFLLTPVIEKSSDKKLDELLETQIIKPLGLRNTLPISDQETVDSLEHKLVKPYYFYGEVEDGHYDFGLSTASGLASTVRDIAKFDNALDSHSLISRTSTDNMLSPFKTADNSEYPYGYGIFTQKFLGKEMQWGYGQEDCFSSLLLKVPEEGLTLILLANNNLMSDPARLINGDITYSLFAMSFLKNFVFNLPHKLDFEDLKSPEKLDVKLKSEQADLAPYYRQELLANALAASFMGFNDSLELERSKKLTKKALLEFPDHKQYGNQTLMRLFMVHSTYGNARDFDIQLEELGDELLLKNKYDPYTNMYLGYHYNQLEEAEKANEHFKNIVEAPNLQPFWYTIEACDFLGDFYKESKPEIAKKYFQKIVDIGWNMGGKLDKAKSELDNL